MNLRSTYRVQFNRNFTFADAAKTVPYLSELGISHVYASPILAARAGSSHGYDVVDHKRINPELGGEPGFREFVSVLHSHKLGLILDIVPNHMAVGGADNPYWLDILEKGRGSAFAKFFDIDWESSQLKLQDKVIAPFLEKPLPEAIEAGEVRLVWDDALKKIAFTCGVHRFPLRPEEHSSILVGVSDPSRARLEQFNNPQGLSSLLARQNFVLTCWRDAGNQVNWRRFFDITGLAALRIEDERVFEAVHEVVFRLYGEGLIDGVRVDHVDGLADPATYCRRLRARLESLVPVRNNQESPYIVVEKILAPGERLPKTWNIDGTTGYDFLDQASALFHSEGGAESLSKLWAKISGRSADFEVEECEARCEITRDSFGYALRATAAAFYTIAGDVGVDQSAFERALTQLLEYFRAYRTYASGDHPESSPGPQFEAACERVRRLVGADAHAALQSVINTMHGQKAALGKSAFDAVRRFNQLAASVAAKAVEDTAFYRYGRLLSRNDVGCSPRQFALSRDTFLSAMRERRESWSSGLLTTATHDHKRGEDARMRLAVLSEIHEVWESEVCSWFDINGHLSKGGLAPRDEYQLYQALVGCWPADFQLKDKERLPDIAKRVLAWREKSLREAKLETSWSAPNLSFEEDNAAFVRGILDPNISGLFLERLVSFIHRIAPAAALNSLSQCILRNTCPGTPDLYQGTELWDFSLVDPDNRGAVDFIERRRFLREGRAPLSCLSAWQTGEVKLSLIARLLTLRAMVPDCFQRGGFRPLTVKGDNAQCVIAFARESNHASVVVAVPRLCAEICMTTGMPLPPAAFWGDCNILPPRSGTWRNGLDPTMPAVADFTCASLFAEFPAAVLVGQSG